MRRLVATRRLLCDEAEPQPLLQRDRSAIGLQRAADEAEQRRFPRAVAADEPDLQPGIDPRRGALEERPAADAVYEIADRQHGGGVIARPAELWQCPLSARGADGYGGLCLCA